jgi:ATP/maltotriose-dependent transcriptional regulator MalT/DNA-binding SARP family transcriptional activator
VALTRRSRAAAAKKVARNAAGGRTRKAPRSKRSALPAKLTRPHAGALLARQRIFSQLDAGDGHRWTWIGAPAGAGKTALASSWIELRRYACLWYQLDAGDADPATFFHYLILAGLNRAGRKRVYLPPLTPEFLPGLELYARRFFEQLFDLYAEPFVVVLDNVHDVPAAAPLTGTILAALLDSLPSQGRLICLSRIGMPPALARWSTQPGFQQLRWEDLSLTDEEALALAKTIEPTGAEVAVRCNHWVRGWITGVKLLLRTAPEEFHRLSAHEDVAAQGLFDYYAQEVVERKPSALRDFLLRAALLEEMEAGAVAAVTERHDAATVLAELYAERLFIERRMLPGGWSYQFHPLFRTFLRARLARMLTPAEIAAMRTRAAASLEAHGQLEAAAVVALECDDTALLARLILAQAPQLVADGRLSTLETWLRAVPDAVRKRDGWLLYWLGQSCALRDPLFSRTCLGQAYRRFRKSGDTPGEWLACSSLISSHFRAWGTHPEKMWQWVDAFETLRADHGGFIPTGIELQVMAHLHMMVGHCPEHPLSRHLVDRARLLAPRLTEPGERCGVGAMAVGFLTWQGDEAAARALIDELRPESIDDVRISAATITFEIWRATLLWTGSEHERCFSHLYATRERSRLAGLGFGWLISGHLATCALSAGDAILAGEALREGSRSLQPFQINDRYLMQTTKAIQLALAGERHAGAALARELLGSENMTNAPSSAAFTRSFLAVALLEDGALDEAERCCSKMLELAGRLPSDRWLFEGYMLLAGVELERGAQSAALDRLRQALRLASQRNFRGGVSLWQPIRTAKLLALALRHGIEADYVQRLIRHRKLPPPAEIGIGALWPVRLRVATLGRFGVWIDAQPLRFSQSAGRKPLEVLKALIGLGTADISLATLGASVWPELDGAAAHNACHVAIHRLRKILGDESAIRIDHGMVALNWADAWADVEAFRRLASHIRAALGGGLRLQSEMERLAGQLLQAYPGHFLPGEDRPWVIGVREQLRARFVHLAIEVAGALERAGAAEAAVALNRHGIEIDPLADRAGAQGRGAGGVSSLLRNTAGWTARGTLG